MDERKENDLLEETLSISETDYAQAYQFLLAAYEKEPTVNAAAWENQASVIRSIVACSSSEKAVFSSAWMLSRI